MEVPMRRHDYNAIMLPTSDKGRGRWIRYRFRNLYPGPATICPGDSLALREAAQQAGYRMRPSELKIHIKRSLGFKSLTA